MIGDDREGDMPSMTERASILGGIKALVYGGGLSRLSRLPHISKRNRIPNNSHPLNFG
jgi:hypothetical protein